MLMHALNLELGVNHVRPIMSDSTATVLVLAAVFENYLRVPLSNFCSFFEASSVTYRGAVRQHEISFSAAMPGKLLVVH